MYSHVHAHIAGGTAAYNPVTSTVLNADGSHNVAAGLLAYITVSNAAGLANLKIGTTPGGNELYEGAVAAGVPEVVSPGIRLTALTTIYFTNITSTTNISFYKF